MQISLFKMEISAKKKKLYALNGFKPKWIAVLQTFPSIRFYSNPSALTIKLISFHFKFLTINEAKTLKNV